MQDHPVVKSLMDTGEPWAREAVINCICCGDGIYEGDEYFLIEGVAYCETCAKAIFGRTA